MSLSKVLKHTVLALGLVLPVSAFAANCPSPSNLMFDSYDGYSGYWSAYSYEGRYFYSDDYYVMPLSMVRDGYTAHFWYQHMDDLGSTTCSYQLRDNYGAIGPTVRIKSIDDTWWYEDAYFDDMYDLFDDWHGTIDDWFWGWGA